MSFGEQVEFYESDISYLSMSVAFKLSAITLIRELGSEYQILMKAYESQNNSLNPYCNLSPVDRMGLHDRARVILYLLGMSIELGLKALIRKSVPDSIEDNHHDLCKLSQKAKFTLLKNENKLLEFLTHVVQWAGKYKIPNPNKKDLKKNNFAPIDIFSVSTELSNYSPYWALQKNDRHSQHTTLQEKAEKKIEKYKEEDIKYLNTDNNIYSTWLSENSQMTLQILERIHDSQLWFQT